MADTWHRPKPFWAGSRTSASRWPWGSPKTATRGIRVLCHIRPSFCRSADAGRHDRRLLIPIAWPAGWPRTPTDRQDRVYPFKKLGSNGWRDKFIWFAEARDGLLDELRRLAANSPVVSANHPTDRYGVPTEWKKRVLDDGVAAYFQSSGPPMVMASDRFQSVAANLRSLALAIEAMRQLERHGGGTMMERALTGFVALLARKDPHEILGVRPEATPEEIDAAFRQKAKSAHPDAGGSAEAMQALVEARDRLREGS